MHKFKCTSLFRASEHDPVNKLCVCICSACVHTSLIWWPAIAVSLCPYKCKIQKPAHTAIVSYRIFQALSMRFDKQQGS